MPLAALGQHVPEQDDVIGHDPVRAQVEQAGHPEPVVRRVRRIVVRAARLERKSRDRAHALRTEPDGHPWHPEAIREDYLQLRAMDRQLKAIDLLLHYSGLAEPDEPLRHPAGTGPDARRALLERIAALIKAGEPATDPPKRLN